MKKHEIRDAGKAARSNATPPPSSSSPTPTGAST
jgi:hypothetical protein